MMTYRILKHDKSTVHIVEAPVKEFQLIPTLGTVGKLEPLLKIVNDFEAKHKVDVSAGINAGFFNLNGSDEHLGNFIVPRGLDPRNESAPSETFIDLVALTDGRFMVSKTPITRPMADKLMPTVDFILSASYALLIEGKIDLDNAEKFSHAGSRQPRTMFGWNKVKGTFLMVVCDGRTATSLGLTAKSQAVLMQSLGCFCAVNFDGGGSSELVYDKGDKDRVMNRPSDGNERSIGSALIAIPRG